ncbi:hypothetical protein [Mesorhizobium sp. Root552]|uniref:hypothetical protein n=1 Tax=Mesorhizobium sp. Root552 TaxID=1736555 RepID=UPI000B071637|nr:hypothetical protein [Mesorhizobium sp. Root552]
MNPLTWLGFVLSACVFAVVFLGGVIVYGDEVARSIAITAAFFACVSQFIGQDQRVWKASIVTAWIAFAVSACALVAFWFGV